MTKLIVMQDELKVYPFGDIWNEYCRRCNTLADTEWLAEVEEYEKNVLLNR